MNLLEAFCTKNFPLNIMCWQSNHFHSLLIEDWGGEYTVFQPDSGKTHFLNQMSMQILERLNQDPVTTEEISAYLAEHFQQEPNQNFLHNIEKILYYFDTLGLINKVN